VYSRFHPRDVLRHHPRESSGRHPRAGGDPEDNARIAGPYAPAQAAAGTGIRFLLLLLLLFLAAPFLSVPAFAGTDPNPRLVIAEGYEQVKANCTVCHSARLISQNRADREGWIRMIRWMQEKQGLWPLGDAESVIFDYLADNYGPLPQSALPRVRRAPLNVTFD
jgi:hypothetical protein